MSKLEKYMTSAKEYVPSRAPVFYNPLMKVNRDLAISFLKSVCADSNANINMGDPLAGVGVRSIRALLETGSVREASANDINEQAFRLMKRNARVNRLNERMTISQKDANVFLAEHSEPGGRFGYVDVDPFGSPSPFLDNAVMSVCHRGFLAVTATDTPVLYGIYPKKMTLMYDSYSPRLPFLKEVGVRVLMGAVARVAARHSIGVVPLLGYVERNYARAYFEVLRSRSKASSALEKVGFVNVSLDPLRWEVLRRGEPSHGIGGAGPSGVLCGPMWIGRYVDPDLAAKLRDRGLGTSPQCDGLIHKLCGEMSDIVGYYPHELLAKACGGGALRIAEILDRLRGGGVMASRTIFDPAGVKADTDFARLTDVLTKGATGP